MLRRRIQIPLWSLSAIALAIFVAVAGVAAGGATITPDPVANTSTDQIGGATIENLSPDVAQQLGLPPMMPGIVVTDVDPSSPAARSGMLPGDIIVAVNNAAVQSVTQLKDTIWWMGVTPVVFSVIRDGADYIFTFPVW